MQKTISIVVAIFNRKDELFELLNSLIAQTDKDFEVIIVDDGSFVDLLPTVETFKEMLNIQYFKKANSGPGLSRNYGANRAKNDWLVFVDSDVIVEKDYIENIKKPRPSTDRKIRPNKLVKSYWQKDQPRQITRNTQGI